MATEMEKDVLIEYVGGAIALTRKDKTDTAEKLRKELKEIENNIYATSYKELDYTQLSEEIKNMRKPYEY